MGSYAQWRKGADKGTVRRFTWICGTEHVLVNEVTEWTLNRLYPEADWFDFLAGGFHSDSQIWQTAAALPADMSRKHLVLVRHADLIQNWEPLADLAGHYRELRHLYMVFVSPEETLPKTEEGLAPHLAVLRDSSQGQLVVCSTPSDADLLAWVKRQLPMGDNLAYWLITRTAGNLAAIRDTCHKAALLGQKPSEGLFTELCPPAPATSFADALCAADKKAALEAVPELEIDEFGSVVGLLDSRLEMLSAMNRAVADGMSAADIHSRLKVPQFLIGRFRRYAPAYTRAVVRRRRGALATVDAAWRGGARDGIAEVLVALW